MEIATRMQFHYTGSRLKETSIFWTMIHWPWAQWVECFPQSMGLISLFSFYNPVHYCVSNHLKQLSTIALPYSDT